MKKQSLTNDKTQKTPKNNEELALKRKNDGADIVANIKLAHIDEYDELETYKKLLKKRRRRLVGRIFTFLLLLVVLPVMIFLTSIVIDKNGKHNFFGYTYYVVATPSMYPEIKVNDCVVLKHVSSREELHVGDDIGYINASGVVIVHRIMAIETNSSGEIVYKTKGINNANYDQLAVSFDSIVGKRVATMHILGNSIVFFRSTAGIIMLVLIFASIIAGFYFAFRLSENIKYVDQVTKKE